MASAAEVKRQQAEQLLKQAQVEEAQARADAEIEAAQARADAEKKVIRQSASSSASGSSGTTSGVGIIDKLLGG